MLLLFDASLLVCSYLEHVCFKLLEDQNFCDAVSYPQSHLLSQFLMK
jgi:hypothetical protein